MEAIALAGNVIQFTELSGKFVSNCYRFYDDWEEAARKHQELNDVMIHLRTLLGKMTPALHKTEFPELSRIIERCFTLIQDMLDLLKRLKTRAPSGKMDRVIQSLKFAAKQMVKDEEIKELETRIYRLRDAIASHADLLLMGQLEDLGHSIIPNAGKEPATSPYSSLEATRNNLRLELGTARRRIQNRDLLDVVRIISKLEPAFEPFQKTRRIVRSLHFEHIRARESDIQEAYENTFRWIFEDRTSQFTEWLQGEHGIYWITGKAGAGKSTLMKYLTGNRRTHNSLQLWGGDELIIAKHHFWSAGTPLQMSQEGLLRTILQEILLRRPDLCEKICPQQWHDDTLLDVHSWKINELLESLMNLGNLTGNFVEESGEESGQESGGESDQESVEESVEEDTRTVERESQSVKICIFIDGLDEYSGDHANLSQLVQKLADFPNIKLCVASREWNDFSEAFGDSQWLLRLHERTEMDILTFTSKSFEENKQFQVLKQKSPEDAMSLVQQITERAQGVFLWVFLVVRSLLRGLRNEDSLPTLHKRMLELPNQLEEFFGRMLKTIEPVYMMSAVRTLLMVSRSNGPFSLLMFLFLDLEQDGSGIRSTASIPLENWPDIDPDAKEMLRVKKKQLVAQCRDLLHISTYPEQPELLGERVGPLHRTVLDYLRTQPVNTLLLREAGAEFEPNRALLVAHTRQVQVLIRKASLAHLKEHLRRWLDNIFVFAVNLELCTAQTDVQVLDEFGQFLASLFHEYHYPSFAAGMEAFFQITDDTSSFMSFAAHRGLKIYPEVKGFSLDELICSDLTDEKDVVDASGGMNNDLNERGYAIRRIGIWHRVRNLLHV